MTFFPMGDVLWPMDANGPTVMGKGSVVYKMMTFFGT